MTPLILLILASEITGDRADSIARAFLKAGAVPGPYRIQRLGAIEGGSVTTFRLSYTTKAGAYDLYVRGADGKVRFAWRSAPKVSAGAPAPASSRDLTAVRAALAALGVPTDSLGPAPGATSSMEMVSARMAILVDGRRVFSGPHMAGYSVTLAGDRRRLLGFERQDELPVVLRSVPRLGRGDALKALRRSCEPSDRRSRLVHFGPARDPELVYYTPDGKAPARLCWYVPAHVLVDIGHSVRGGSRTVLVDAATGEGVPVPVQLSDGPLPQRK